MLKNIFNNPGLQHIAETIFCNLNYEDLELRFKAGKAIKEGLYYGILPSRHSVFELESIRQSVEFNKMQTVPLKMRQVQ